MTSDQLTNYLNDLRLLKSVNEKELLALTKKHPYCQSLHYMMVRKAQMEYSVNYERLLHLASTYATDRAFLYQLIHREELQLQQEVAQADVLILNTIHDKVQNDDHLEMIPEAAPVLLSTPIVLENQEENLQILEPLSATNVLDQSHAIEPESVQNQIAIGAPETLAQALDLDGDDDELMTLDQLLEAKTESQIIDNQDVVIDELSVEDLSADVDYDSETEDELLTLDQISAEKTEPIIQDVPSYETFLAQQQALEHKHSAPIEEEEYELMTVSDLQQNDAEASEPSAANEIELELMPKTQILAEPSVVPLPKSSFSSWLRKFKKPESVDVSVPIESETDFVQYAEKIDEKFKDKKVGKEKVKKKKKNAELIAFAEQSLIHNEQISSETLAQLLEEHGRKDRAIHIYEKLMLHIPEKSLYFATEIERLKKSTV